MAGVADRPPVAPAATRWSPAPSRHAGGAAPAPPTYDEELLGRLKAWRTDEAARRSVPAYVVFTDATLESVATELPADIRALVGIPGIGARKLEAYAVAVLALVRGEDPPAGADDPA